MSAPAPAIDLRDRSVFATWTGDTIRYRDIDPNGHVNNGAINMFFEDGRVHFRDVRMTMLGDNILTGFAVARFTATYLAPLRYPGAVKVGTVVTRIGRSSFELGQGVFSGERCIATAGVVSVYSVCRPAFFPARRTSRTTRRPSRCDRKSSAVSPTMWR